MIRESEPSPKVAMHLCSLFTCEILYLSHHFVNHRSTYNTIIIYLWVEYSWDNTSVNHILCWLLFHLPDWFLFLTWFHITEIFQAGERILCRHPFLESKRAYVVPQHVEELLQCYWPGSSSMDLITLLTSLNSPREIWKGKSSAIYYRRNRVVQLIRETENWSSKKPGFVQEQAKATNCSYSWNEKTTNQW